jgi:hypothetical protein
MPPDKRVERSLSAWTNGSSFEKLPGAPFAPPALVVVSSNLWDLAGERRPASLKFEGFQS